MLRKIQEKGKVLQQMPYIAKNTTKNRKSSCVIICLKVSCNKKEFSCFCALSAFSFLFNSTLFKGVC